MNRDLETYLLRIDNWIDPGIRQQALAEIAPGPWQKHTYGTHESEGVSAGGDRELEVTFAGDSGAAALMMPKIARAFEFYTVRFRMPWLSAPRHRSEVRFNRYETGQIMLEHCDQIHSLFDGKNRGVLILTFLALLNDDFSGGELVLWGDQVIPMTAGTMVVFPSNFLFPHRVEPVTEGTRYSAVSWAW